MKQSFALLFTLAAVACVSPKTEPVEPAAPAPAEPCTKERAYAAGIEALKARFGDATVKATGFDSMLVAAGDSYMVEGRAVVNNAASYYWQANVLCTDGAMNATGVAVFDVLPQSVELGSGIPCDGAAAADLAIDLVRSCMAATPEPLFPAAEARTVTSWGAGTWNVSGFVQRGESKDHFYVALMCRDGAWSYDALALNYLSATPGMGF